MLASKLLTRGKKSLELKNEEVTTSLVKRKKKGSGISRYCFVFTYK